MNSYLTGDHVIDGRAFAREVALTVSNVPAELCSQPAKLCALADTGENFDQRMQCMKETFVFCHGSGT